MSRRKSHPEEANGDSFFIDVICNLVGILIILVMVVGARAHSTALELAKQAVTRPKVTEVSTSPADEKQFEELENAAADHRGMQQAFAEVEARIAEEKLALQMREAERNQVQIVVSVAEQRLEEHRSELSEKEKEEYDLQTQLASAKSELTRLNQAKQVAGEKPPPQVLEHYPTPMAKTVFGTELHFRLKDGRIAFVPWDQLVDRLKKDAPHKVERLRDQDRIEETMPPLGNFAMKYALVKTQGVLQTRSGMTSGTRIELERFVLIPVREPLGEPVREALANPRSELMSRLSEYGPRRATLTVWVYPESFEDFRVLKGEMYKQGYLTAARPLPPGMPIGGSPDGSRSNAE